MEKHATIWYNTQQCEQLCDTFARQKVWKRFWNFKPFHWPIYFNRIDWTDRLSLLESSSLLNRLCFDFLPQCAFKCTEPTPDSIRSARRSISVNQPFSAEKYSQDDYLPNTVNKLIDRDTKGLWLRRRQCVTFGHQQHVATWNSAVTARGYIIKHAASTVDVALRIDHLWSASYQATLQVTAKEWQLKE